MNIENWQAIALYGEILDKLGDLPSPLTDEAYEERASIRKWLEGKRKVYVDAAYELYLEHERRPWCDVCGQPVVFREFYGWYHSGEHPRLVDHSVETHEYSAGWEAEVIKRLKFEI